MKVKNVKIVKQSDKLIPELIKILSQGKLIFTATETVYIAAVDATNPKAVRKLVKFKNRPFGKPFSIGVADINMAKKYVHINQAAEKLYKNFLPGPLTIISKSKGKVAPGIEAENKTLGIRIPDYPFFLKLVRAYGKPLTTTSANASYQRRPYKLNHILDNINQKQKDLIDLMIDAGTLPTREPSTVIDTTMEDPATLRQGDIKLKNKNEVLSKNEESTQNIAKELWQKYQNYHKKRPIVFALEGKMGTGKTIFTKGLAKAMGIKKNVVSPTYDLLNDYKNLIHIDTWRMVESEKEFKELGINKMLDKNTVFSIEWAEKVKDIIRKYADDALIIWVKINYGKTETQRLITWGVL